ncbi:MAG: hypothetical protein ABIM32_06205, partial [candidate division WOR-3 bacterium]
LKSKLERRLHLGEIRVSNREVELFDAFRKLESFLKQLLMIFFAVIYKNENKEFEREVEKMVFNKDFNFGKIINEIRELIGRCMGTHISKIFGTEEIRLVDEVRRIRNRVAHWNCRNLRIDQIVDILSRLENFYFRIEREFPFAIVKPLKIVEDCNGRKYLVVNSLDAKREMILYFSNKTLEQIDPTYLYVVYPSNSRIIVNPILVPIYFQISRPL